MNVDGSITLGGIDPPLRRTLHDELHARPSLYFHGDTDVWHVAIVSEDGMPCIPSQLLDLETATKTQDGRHGVAPFKGGNWVFRGVKSVTAPHPARHHTPSTKAEKRDWRFRVSEEVSLGLAEAEELAMRACRAAGAGEATARSLVDAT